MSCYWSRLTEGRQVRYSGDSCGRETLNEQRLRPGLPPPNGDRRGTDVFAIEELVPR